MRITADFTQISSSFQALEDGEYQCQITEIEEGETKANKLPQVLIKSEVKDPNHADKDGHVLYDYIVLVQKNGKPNKIGLGQIKAYAEAVLGNDAANNPEGIDLDDLKNGTFLAVVKQRSYTPKVEEGQPAADQRITNEIVKVLPVS